MRVGARPLISNARIGLHAAANGATAVTILIIVPVKIASSIVGDRITLVVAVEDLVAVQGMVRRDRIVGSAVMAMAMTEETRTLTMKRRTVAERNPGIVILAVVTDSSPCIFNLITFHKHKVSFISNQEDIGV